MSQQPHSLRGQIIELVRDRIHHFYGTGSANPLIRQFHIGPWKPGMPASSLVLTDAGAEQRESEVAGYMPHKVLRIGMVANLPANWDRSDSLRKWQGFVEGVEAILADLRNQEEELGLIKAELVQDEPLEVTLTAGATVHIWALEADIHFAAQWEMPQEPEDPEEPEPEP